MNFFLDMMPREIYQDIISQGGDFQDMDMKRITSAGTLMGTKASPGGTLQNNLYQDAQSLP